MDKLTGFLGRLLYAVPFLFFGAGHFMNAQGMKGMVPSFLPGGVLWVYVTGAAMVLAGLAIVTGQQARHACFGLAALLLAYMVLVHLPGMGEESTKMMSMMNFFKDMGLMGAALALAPTFSQAPPKKKS